MTDPQLRCLLCDLILADEKAQNQPTETCKQCGRKVLAGQAAGAGEVELQPLNPPPRSNPIDLDLDTLPEAAIVPPTSPPLEDNIPSVPVRSQAKRVEADVPTVQPRGKITSDPASVPYVARRAEPPPARPATKPAPQFPPAGKPEPPRPTRKVNLPDPTRTASVAPRPKVLQAFAILGCMTFLGIVAVIVIITCIVAGLMKAGRVGG
ncbi:MAG: hypothetical protein MUF18_10450 [Fimbriiglobus sp.]|nr:hypothetical protein [Fimbriiglobus sp.]